MFTDGLPAEGSKRKGRKRGGTTVSRASGKSEASENSLAVGPGPDRRRLSVEVNENGVSRTRASSVYATSDHGHPGSPGDLVGTDDEGSRYWGEGFDSAYEMDDEEVEYDEFGYRVDERRRSSRGEDDRPSDDEDAGEGAFDLDDLPVVGFAVASVKRNADFHALFGKVVPEDDYLIEGGRHLFFLFFE